VTTHVIGEQHKQFAASASSASTRSVASYFRPEVAMNVLEAEIKWAMFTAKHNLAFLSSDHASKLFAKMFPDSEIWLWEDEMYSCQRSPGSTLYHGKAIEQMSHPYSILIDESNDKETSPALFWQGFLMKKLEM